mmetsp:Transcript_29095/g.43980  ORF Transcript_29095/g.43980 Transcript_29095/m.43980 type:complete len:325 (-) Transcript_29095:68-1042(-)|eukprot:CAMPEP_0178927586 /NCGR_PEP_ID=MMETSP0786-20121207/19288_1 /TAXON_ID=186022 /ORGANISM="Thalassionema frauenfeldii, Strain CCMP 1798" /LENGTH=324 /DNA_ID=CAMNT_0020603071 /DNA_START=31 /DNA_END=1005 /DNA_ORIENTATION=-
MGNLLSLFLCLSILTIRSVCADNAPFIGVFSQPFFNEDQNTTENIIAASYVKWLEVAGARSIPIPHNASISQVETLFPQIDGLLLPGGDGLRLPMASRRLWELAETANEMGEFFPVWGTCLGFEYMVRLASGRDDILEGGYDAENISLPLKRTASVSRLYAGFETIIQDQNLTLNNHHQGISPTSFKQNAQLVSLFDITSTNEDRQGRAFVSTMESKDPDRKPYYGVQYHPEKNAFEYGQSDEGISYYAIDHSPMGLHFSIHLANFFVNLTRTSRRLRRNNTSSKMTIGPVYTYPRKVGSRHFQEYYVIDDWKNNNDPAISMVG